MSIEVRPPRDEEMAAVVDLRWRDLYMPLGLSKNALLRDANTVDSAEGTLHVVAVEDDEIISSVRIERSPKYDFYLSQMVTAEQKRRRGIGRQILSAAERRAYEAG